MTPSQGFGGRLYEHLVSDEAALSETPLAPNRVWKAIQDAPHGGR